MKYRSTSNKGQLSWTVSGVEGVADWRLPYLAVEEIRAPGNSKVTESTAFAELDARIKGGDGDFNTEFLKEIHELVGKTSKVNHALVLTIHGRTDPCVLAYSKIRV